MSPADNSISGAQVKHSALVFVVTVIGNYLAAAEMGNAPFQLKQAIPKASE
jgi:hypothetical protein